jgi:hypothetical protein
LWVRTGFERQVVSASRGRDDLVIDTSLLTVADLKCSLIGHVAFDAVVCAICRVRSLLSGHPAPYRADYLMRAARQPALRRQTSSADPDGSRFHKR